PVTADNFIRAESHLYLGNVVKNGGFGKCFHQPQPMPVNKQDVVRANRDTLYSSAVLDLQAAAATITLPNAGNRFMSLMVVNEDHYVYTVLYGAGDYTFTREKVGTRYILAAVR